MKESNTLNAIVGIIMLILSICLIVDTIQLKSTYCHAKINGVCQRGGR